MTELEAKELQQAQEYLSYWQLQLRLDHIDFEIVISSAEEMGDKLGNCKVCPIRHRQRIILRHPNDRTNTDKEYLRRELEVVIVHELLHTKEVTWRDHPKVMKVMDEDKWLSNLHEDSLDAIAEAMVRARRGIKR